MSRDAGYYWVSIDGGTELIPAAWVGGNWYLPGQHQPANDHSEVREIAKIEPPSGPNRDRI